MAWARCARCRTSMLSYQEAHAQLTTACAALHGVVVLECRYARRLDDQLVASLVEVACRRVAAIETAVSICSAALLREACALYLHVAAAVVSAAEPHARTYQRADGSRRDGVRRGGRG